MWVLGLLVYGISEHKFFSLCFFLSIFLLSGNKWLSERGKMTCHVMFQFFLFNSTITVLYLLIIILLLPFFQSHLCVLISENQFLFWNKILNVLLPSQLSKKKSQYTRNPFNLPRSTFGLNIFVPFLTQISRTKFHFPQSKEAHPAAFMFNNSTTFCSRLNTLLCLQAGAYLLLLRQWYLK